jgi:1,4-dihydroxy-2-naphthoate octaprenyltransferase
MTNLKKIAKHRHKILMYFWMVMIPVTIFTPLKESLLWVLLLSLYANIEASAAAHEAKKGK